MRNVLLNCFFERYEGILRLSYEHLFKKYFGDCKKWLANNSNALDIGCGNGLVSHHLTELTGAKITGIDIDDFRMQKIPFRKFNGKQIPFENNEFDASLLCFVLHHVKDQSSLLKEAKRVTKSHIIVYEDIIEGMLSRILSWTHIAVFSLTYGLEKEKNFRSENEWEIFFNSLGLKVIEKAVVMRNVNLIYPIKRMLFVLGVRSAN